MHKKLLTLIAVLIIATAISAGAAVTSYEYIAGSGTYFASCLIDFGAHSYLFGYRWDTGTPSGFDMISAIDAAGDLSLDIKNYGYGDFVNGISYNGDSKIGYAGDENWWHYWVSADGETWEMSGEGASSRVISNGTWDGWCYGSAGAPDLPGVPEPSSMIALISMLGLAASAKFCRSRK